MEGHLILRHEMHASHSTNYLLKKIGGTSHPMSRSACQPNAPIELTTNITRELKYSHSLYII